MSDESARNPQALAARLKPQYRPGDVPDFAEYSWAIPHFRAQFHPLFDNAHGFADVNGPKEYIGLDYRCLICKHIQPAGAPGTAHQCGRCQTYYFYTATVGACWLWFWKFRREVLNTRAENPNASD